MSPPPGRPRLAPVLFAPAAAEGLSGGWGGDTGGAGGRAEARTGAARGNGRGAKGPRRALFTSRRQSSPGGRAAGGKRVPGGSCRRRRACTPPLRQARQVVPRCSFILTLWEPPAAAGASWSLEKRGCDHDLRLQQNNNKKNLGALRSALVRCPPSGSPAGGAGPGGPRRECRGRSARLGTDSAPRARRPDPLKAPVGHFHSASKGQKNNPWCRESAPGRFRCPSWANLLGCP